MLAPPPYYPECKEHTPVACIVLHGTDLLKKPEYRKPFLYSQATELVNQDSERFEENISENWLFQSAETVLLTHNFFGDSVRRTDEVEEKALAYALQRAIDKNDGRFDLIEW
jgi:hypothetical protein